MRENTGRRAAETIGVAAAVAALLSLGGCCQGVPPSNAFQALTRINHNVLRIRQVLDYHGLVSVKFRDADGRVRRIPARDARLFFLQPQDLRFEIQHGLAGTVAQFGSNDEFYWVWVDYDETRKLWYGHWAALGERETQRIAIPPNDLLDALGLRPLPVALEDSGPPRLEKRGWHTWLVYHRIDAEGQPAGRREIRLDDCPPYQPLEIVERRADGQIAMRANLGQYRQVGDLGPYTARRYVIRWPLDDAELRLDVHQAKFRPDLADMAEDLFEFPANWQGTVEDLDPPDWNADQPQLDSGAEDVPSS